MAIAIRNSRFSVRFAAAVTLLTFLSLIATGCSDRPSEADLPELTARAASFHFGGNFVLTATTSKDQAGKLVEVWAQRPGEQWIKRGKVKVSGSGEISWSWKTADRDFVLEEPYRFRLRFPGRASSNIVSTFIVPGGYALIYNGPVAAEDAPESAAALAKDVGLPVRYISDIKDLPETLRRAVVFIIGGTEDDLEPLLEEFTPKVSSSFRKYLRDGGRYMGICGGGWIASTGWEEEYGFVDALYISPAESEDRDDDYTPRIIPVRWQGETRQMYVQGAPAFDLVESDEVSRVVARYKDGRIAALISSHGKGRVAVSGPHPEARESWTHEAADGERWTSSTDLGEQLLKDLFARKPESTF